MIIGIFIAAAIGAFAAILCILQSGKQTLGQISDVAEKQKEYLKKQWDITKEKTVGLVSSAKEKADQYADNAKNKVTS